MGLTLLKAAEILDLNAKEAGPKMPPDVKESVILGKESLERLDQGRKAGMAWARRLLPCELKGVE